MTFCPINNLEPKIIRLKFSAEKIIELKLDVGQKKSISIIEISADNSSLN
jgi:hypothetical protein